MSGGFFLSSVHGPAIAMPVAWPTVAGVVDFLCRAALARLPERTAKLLLLRYAGLSYAEIAAALQVAPGSVGTLLVRAERAFIQTYEQLPDE